MGNAGRRKRGAEAFESVQYEGYGELRLELAPVQGPKDSGYAGVYWTSSGNWQAVVRVEREGRKVRRNVGSFNSQQTAALQRALALKGEINVFSPALRAERGTGLLLLLPYASFAVSHTLPVLAIRCKCDRQARSLGQHLGERRACFLICPS